MVRKRSACLTKSTVVLVCCVWLAACGADRQDAAVSNTPKAVLAANDQSTTTSTKNQIGTSQTATSQIDTSQTATSQTATSQTATSNTSTSAELETAISVSLPTVPATSTSTTTAPEPTAQDAPPVEVVDQGGSSALARIPAGQSWVPFATFAEVTLVHPSNRIERIGFHESNHDGARQLEPTPEAVSPITLDSRSRGTGSRTAADIVVEPGTEIRAPVTGTVIRAGGYVLYCDHQDDFLVIEPDARPGWEVKLLHINGVMVTAGDRVEAGVTVVAPEATVLPFDSQVDEFTKTPPWPHVHIELVDPSIPDRPSTGGGC